MDAARRNKHGDIVPVLRAGERVVINQGPLLNMFAHVLDPVAVPDGQPNQRKVKVLTEADDTELYVLPRQLDLADVQAPNRPITQQEQDAMMATVTESMPSDTNAQGDTYITHVPALPEITDPMHPALDQFRPDPDIVEQYKSRKLPGGYSDTEMLMHLRDQRTDDGYSPNVALVGPTQSGKTMMVQVLACIMAERDGLPQPYPVFTLNGSAGISNYDLFGKTTAVIENGVEQLVWMDGVVPMAMRAGGILYLDEWNAVPPAQAVTLHGALDDRRQYTNTHRAVSNGVGGYMPEVIKANKNLFTIVTINPVGYRGTQVMAEATTNRFRWLDWGYDPEVEKELIPSEQVRFLGDYIRQNAAVKTPVGTSALMRLNMDLAQFGSEFAIESFLAMFQTERDRLAVEEIIELNNFEDRLASEYSNRLISPAS